MRARLLEFTPQRIELGIGDTDLGLPHFEFTPEQAHRGFAEGQEEVRAAYASLSLILPFAAYNQEPFVLDLDFPRDCVPLVQILAHHWQYILKRPEPIPVEFPRLVDWSWPVPGGNVGRYVMAYSGGVDSAYGLARAVADGIRPLALTINTPYHPLPGEDADVADFFGFNFPQHRIKYMPTLIGDLPYPDFWNLYWFYAYWMGVCALACPPPAIILWSTCFWWRWPDDVRYYMDLPSGAPAHLYLLRLMGYYPLYAHETTNRGQRIRGIADLQPSWLSRMGSCWGPGVWGPARNCGVCEKCATNISGMVAYGVSPSVWTWEGNWQENPYLLKQVACDHMSAYYFPWFAQEALRAQCVHGDPDQWAQGVEMMRSWA